MEREHAIARYRRWYRKLLRFYSRPYRERFAESMEQTFTDACRDRAGAEKGILGFVLWAFVDTSAGIMKNNATYIMMQHKNIIRIALVTACILLIPLLGGAPWSLSDFIVAGVLLFGTGLAYELVTRKGGNTWYRVGVGVACGAALLLVWMNLAVGLIGSEDNPANAMYAGVLAALIIGASLARLEPRGMARALFATAIAQALVPVTALAIWRPLITSGVAQVFGVNALFVALWVVSAMLFRHAADTGSRPREEERGRSASREGAVD